VRIPDGKKQDVLGLCKITQTTVVPCPVDLAAGLDLDLFAVEKDRAVKDFYPCGANDFRMSDGIAENRAFSGGGRVGNTQLKPRVDRGGPPALRGLPRHKTELKRGL
jgi:hypothetical protein